MAKDSCRSDSIVYAAPAIAIVCAALVLGESLSFRQMLGAFSIVGSVFPSFCGQHLGA
ncbi:MAG: EamA family transporter [Porticoccaceae bacterium]